MFVAVDPERSSLGQSFYPPSVSFKKETSGIHWHPWRESGDRHLWRHAHPHASMTDSVDYVLQSVEADSYRPLGSEKLSSHTHSYYSWYAVRAQVDVKSFEEEEREQAVQDYDKIPRRRSQEDESLMSTPVQARLQMVHRHLYQPNHPHHQGRDDSAEWWEEAMELDRTCGWTILIRLTTRVEEPDPPLQWGGNPGVVTLKLRIDEGREEKSPCADPLPLEPAEVGVVRSLVLFVKRAVMDIEAPVEQEQAREQTKVSRRRGGGSACSGSGSGSSRCSGSGGEAAAVAPASPLTGTKRK
ncbi:hypothetical protein JB92DRAFT_3159663 [Gautieria morchelliformis]|nr:hypothetical protein JB92DRAFT_3159663 [Gautieria morchelliformis]